MTNVDLGDQHSITTYKVNIAKFMYTSLSYYSVNVPKLSFRERKNSNYKNKSKNSNDS